MILLEVLWDQLVNQNRLDFCLSFDACLHFLEHVRYQFHSKEVVRVLHYCPLLIEILEL